MDIKKKLKKLPNRCGVYIMKSKNKKVLYIGKASSLKSRVSSYFSGNYKKRNDMLVNNIASIDYVECQTQEQALILEAALIKEKKPKYNIALRDNKSYPYLAVTKEKFPRIFICRPKGKGKNILFGPYPVASILRPALAAMREVFGYRSCKTMPKSACLFFHLKLCPAPCIGKISFSAYKVNIESICRLLKGQRRELTRTLKAKMRKLAKEKHFEQAASLRDRLKAIDNLYKGKPKTHEMISAKLTFGLPAIPLNIEAIDISSLGNSDSVGSVVVFRDGVPDKSSYRRFKIRETEGMDDYAMMAEVVRRRYSRLKKEKRAFPDLIIIDGGKGHLMRSYKVLKSLGISIPIISIAKQNEEIWLPFKRNPLRISRSQPCLHLIQRIRDEAHRFAHAYGLIRRKKRIFKP
jgi:excinuclease ABC subunit C